MSETTWALIGVIIGTFGTGFFNWLLQHSQLKHTREMWLLQNRSAEMVKQILTDMLSHIRHTERSFGALKAPIGGYADDAIRQFLHEIGAKKVTREDGSEWWYLLSRQEERNANKK